MLTSTAHEAVIFALMAALGAALGAVFDMLRALSSTPAAKKTGNAATHITDALFWSAGGAAVVYILINCNDGVLRIYEFLGIFLGAVIYFFTLSTHLRRLFGIIFNFADKFISLILKIVLTPPLFLYKILLRGICALRMLIRKKKA